MRQNNADEIVMEGTGIVEAIPDTAIITLLVKTDGSKPLDVEIANDNKITNYKKQLEDFGIKDRDIKEVKSSIVPVTDENGNVKYYEGFTYLNVYLYELSLLREYLYNAENLGLEPIRVNFTVKDPSYHYDQALQKATLDGINKAKQIGELLNMFVDLNPHRIVETTSVHDMIEELSVKTQEDLSTLNYGAITFHASVTEYFNVKQ
ncbi:SIMPL domain-containing protein [Vallitalea okinawensis]|uniref:SIMPL domain-containing protein n=1 Tax=Vallitalea okinawensis TaxID=2078660 RepID=UPI001300A80F|nr:SIMPL domain-containing protein [Vallitalea okinawensis]